MNTGRKGQAAMEFLMTYGWAILVVLVVIGALAYFGVLSPDSLLPGKCTLPVGFSCSDYSITEHSIMLKIQNNAGRDILIQNINITSDALANPCNNPFSTTLKNSDITSFLVVGCPPANTGRDKSRYRVVITYQYTDSNVQHTAYGELLGKRESSTPSVSDDFESGSINPVIWGFNPLRQSVVQDGNNYVLKNIGNSGNIYRTSNSLTEGKFVRLEFKVNPMSGTYVYYNLLQAGTRPNYYYWGIRIDSSSGNGIYAYRSVLSDLTNYPGINQLIMSPAEQDTWYVLYFKVGSSNGVYTKIYKKDNPSFYAEYTNTMPPGSNYLYRNFVFYSSTTDYFDNYFES
ncbi:hypothetical protein HYY72_04830 [Candidatus Woesearchaeota archaeon]|nr:hypothetical protein [Candidatus Woesearchaeota archaeon]